MAEKTAREAQRADPETAGKTLESARKKKSSGFVAQDELKPRFQFQSALSLGIN